MPKDIRVARTISVVAAGDDGDGVELRLHGRSDKVFATAALPSGLIEPFIAKLRSEAVNKKPAP